MVAAVGTVGLLLMQDVSVRLIVVLVLIILGIFIAIALVWIASRILRKLAERRSESLPETGEEDHVADNAAATVRDEQNP